MTRPKQYTSEVLAALGERGLIPSPESPPPIPAGHVRYYLAVGTQVHDGVAPAAVLAAVLRSLADQISESHNKEPENG